MFKHIAYGGVAVAAALALSGLGADGAGASASRAGAVPGTQLWVHRYNGPANLGDYATAEAVSPSGGTVFVTGSSYAPNSRPNYATVAYNTATGAQRWVQRYNGPANLEDNATAVAVSPAGGTVYVTGTSHGAGTHTDYVTVAYSAATGAQRWVKRYNDPVSGDDHATAVAVSPGGGMVYVTGHGGGAGGRQNYVTVAYNAATGAQRWVSRYNGPGNRDFAWSMAVSPSGDKVFVTGHSYNNNADNTGDYATVAYNAATGARLWVSRYNGPGNGDDDAGSVAVSPSGGTVFVTGTSSSGNSDGYATVAYNAATGARLWTKRYSDGHAQIETENIPFLAVSPSGGTVYITGASSGSTSTDYATVAYNAATGAQLWVSHYNGPGNGFDFARSVAVSPVGGTVFVTGDSTGRAGVVAYATVAYNAATGAQLWVSRYNGPNGYDLASSVAVSPDGAKVFVTGGSDGGGGPGDYATIAYSG